MDRSPERVTSLRVSVCCDLRFGSYLVNTSTVCYNPQFSDKGGLETDIRHVQKYIIEMEIYMFSLLLIFFKKIKGFTSK